MLQESEILCSASQAADGAGGIDPRFLNSRVSQKFGADLSALAPKAAARSGDADLPTKAPLHERRAKLDSVRGLAPPYFKNLGWLGGLPCKGSRPPS